MNKIPCATELARIPPWKYLSMSILSSALNFLRASPSGSRQSNNNKWKEDVEKRYNNLAEISAHLLFSNYKLNLN